VAVEVVPSAASLAATSEFLVTFVGDPLTLMTEDKASITGMVTSTALFSQEAHVAIGIPSRIPGRASLQINAEMANNIFGFAAPLGRVVPDTIVSLRFLPGTTSPLQPPIPLTAPLTPTLNLTFPSSLQMRFVRGQILHPDGRPYAGEAYPARVSFDHVLVSNVVAPDPTGAFTLLVPPDATPAAPDDLVTLTIGVDDNSQDIPILIIGPVSLATLSGPATPVVAPHVYTMPAFSPVTPVTVRVMGDGKGQAGYTVRLRAEIPAAEGVARYERFAMTDSHGEATILVIPGTADIPVLYRASIEAPGDASFPYASLCVADLAIAIGPDGTIPELEPFNLSAKLELVGSVSDDTSAPVADARVTATQMGGATVCVDSTTPNTVSATTTANGIYQLLVEPGTYRLDVKPAAMSAWPRLTQTDPVTVSHATVFPIRLPAREIVEGTVKGPDNATLLPGASITIFQVFCQSAPCPAGTPPPVVLAETQTNSSGYFRAVLPAP
jgi:hypothetical protein